MYEILSTCKGGGYMYCRTIPAHPNRNSKGLYPLHRVLAENMLGRPLDAGEQVHHVDGDKTNNDPDNLQVLSVSDHARLHAKVVDNITIKCSCCNSGFSLKPHAYRLRIKRNKSGKVFCSSSCAAKKTHYRKNE